MPVFASLAARLAVVLLAPAAALAALRLYPHELPPARREWLLRAGPFEVERAAAISERERDELKADAAESRARMNRLQAEVAHLKRERTELIAALAAVTSNERGAHHVVD